MVSVSSPKSGDFSIATINAIKTTNISNSETFYQDYDQGTFYPSDDYSIGIDDDTGAFMIYMDELSTVISALEDDEYWVLITHLYYKDAYFDCEYPDKMVYERIGEISETSSYYMDTAQKLREEYTNFLDLLNDNFYYLGKTYEYVPQGVCPIGDSVLVTMYDSNKEKQPKVVIMTPDGSFKEITLDMPSKTHVGGITYDKEHNIVWITNSNGSVSSFKYDELINSDYATPLCTYEGVGVENQDGDLVASYMTYHNGSIFIGSFNEDENGRVVEYRVNEDGTLGEAINEFEVPPQAQGIAFYTKDGKTYMAVSCSYGRDNNSSLTIYEYKDGNTTVVREYKELPPMLEQVSFNEDGSLVVVFENNADKYRKTGKVQIPSICELSVI